MEAVIDIRVLFEQPRNAELFVRFEDAVAVDYPTKETRHEFQWAFDVGSQSSRQMSGVGGYLFRSADKSRVVQSKPEGFSFSQLHPYDDWETTFAEAWRLWVLYREMFSPVRVMRVATRFINRLDLPGPLLDFDDYLTVSPRVPPNVPQVIANFSTSVTMPGIVPRTMSMIRMGYDGRVTPDGKVPVVLDIDVVRDCDLAPDDDETLRQEIAELRPVKNDLFFGSLTKKAVEVFE